METKTLSVGNLLRGDTNEEIIALCCWRMCINFISSSIFLFLDIFKSLGTQLFKV